jgi:hypothetical protein
MPYYKIKPFQKNVDYEKECIEKISPIETIDLASVESRGGFAFFKTGLPSFTSFKPSVKLVRYGIYIEDLDNDYVASLWTIAMVESRKEDWFLGVRVMSLIDGRFCFEVWVSEVGQKLNTTLNATLNEQFDLDFSVMTK